LKDSNNTDDRILMNTVL